MVQSIRQSYPSLSLYIADDGGNEEVRVLVQGLGPTRLFSLPFDSGVSEGRNVLLEAATTPFVAILDDDFVFTPRTNLIAALQFLHQNTDIDLVAGGFEDGYIIHGALEVRDDILTLRKGVASGLSEKGYPLYDIVPNFFVARRERIPRWDVSLKTCEHVEYFLRAKRHLLRCAYMPSIFETIHDRSEPPLEYASFRFGRTRHFGAISWEKMGIRERLIIGVDGKVEQHSVFRNEENTGNIENSAIKRYLNILRRPDDPPNESNEASDAKKAEVLARDAIFSARHGFEESDGSDWFSNRLASNECPLYLEASQLFQRELVSREFYRVTAVLPIEAQESSTPLEMSYEHAHSFSENQQKSFVFEKFENLCKTMRVESPSPDGTSFVWGWMGVCPRVARYVYFCKSVAYLQSSRDSTQGTIGSGYYLSLNSHYAALYATGVLGFRSIRPTSIGYTLLLCRVRAGRTYPITRDADYTGRSRHPGPGPRCDHWGEPLLPGFHSHVGFVSEKAYWQVSERKSREEGDECEVCELVVSDPSRVIPVAVVFFKTAPQYT